MEILANKKSEEAGVVMCERKEVVLDEFRGIGFSWASDLLAMVMSLQMDERVPLIKC